ncbi:hypothetical protein ACT3S7_11315 [Corynebacterium sp. AOP34-AQ2-28]|uniref:hypothetical protein n=1 Tax=Corynebacterium sp. AOP34-AQ2-28 TaxID=3457689 RepID=UPI004033AA30
MRATGKDSDSLPARQRARLVLEQEKKDLERKEKALSRVFTELDKREDADRRLGDRLRALKDLGMTNSALARETGLAAKELSALLALEPSGQPDHDDESSAQTDGGSEDTELDDRGEDISSSSDQREHAAALS